MVLKTYNVIFALTDLQSLLLYANGCLNFKNYLECIEICDSAIKSKNCIQNEGDSATKLIQMKIIKGKAQFYAYKRKLQYLIANDDIM